MRERRVRASRLSGRLQSAAPQRAEPTALALVEPSGTPERPSGIVPAERAPLTDLLHPEPFLRNDRHRLRQALVFGFASGDSGRVFEELLDRGAVPQSSWDPAYFAADLFIPELVERCLYVELDGHRFSTCQRFLTKLVSHPPRDPVTTKFRQEIMAELVSRPELERALGELYLSLVKLRDLLSSGGLGTRYDTLQRKFDILRCVQRLPDGLAPFGDSASGLARLGGLGAWMRDEASFERLRELLDFEGNAAEIELRVRLGYDGEVRQLTPLALRENRTNRYQLSWYRRFVDRMALFFRGYALRSTEVVSRYLDEVVSGLEEPLLHALQLTLDLEFYLAGLGFRRRAEARSLAVCLPELSPQRDAATRLERLFNPLLLSDGVDVVPCDLQAGPPPAILILTGPNSGGKTRLLQSVAHTQLLAQAGLFVPAARARMPWVGGLFVSLIEHATPDQAEGRLGTELMRIRRVFERLCPGSLVVLDELCSGTNPSEGEEIFRLVVDLLLELEPRALITTHFLSFAAKLREDAPQLGFLQVELDAQELPTFQFIPGVAATSLAQRTAARLGVTRDQLRELIRRNRG